MQIVNVFLRAFFGFSLILAVFALMNTAHFAWGQGLVWAAPEEARAGGEAFMADQKLTDIKPAGGKSFGSKSPTGKRPASKPHAHNRRRP